MFTSNLIFFISALATIIGAVYVATTKNIMHACISLLLSLLGVAGLYISMAADFIAVTQLMVYVGGIVILMVFAIILTGGKDFKSKAQELFKLAPSMGNKQTVIFSSVVTLFLAATLIPTLMHLGIGDNYKNFSTTPTITELGKLLVTDYFLVFELSSVVLLGALIGAAIIARPNK
jgi:NADH-quinone oxidoreductase subunit J